MKPIERAARALCTLDGNPADTSPDGRPLWQSYLPKVVAVIDALHEPSSRMKEAGGELFNAYNPDQEEFAHQSDAANVWRLMLDAMQKDVD